MATCSLELRLFCYFYFLYHVQSAVSLKYSRAELLLLRSNVGEATSAPNPSQLTEFSRAIEVSQPRIQSTQAKYMKRSGRKRGKRGGLLVRLRHRNCKTPVPSVILSNVQRLCDTAESTPNEDMTRCIFLCRFFYGVCIYFNKTKDPEKIQMNKFHINTMLWQIPMEQRNS